MIDIGRMEQALKGKRFYLVEGLSREERRVGMCLKNWCTVHKAPIDCRDKAELLYYCDLSDGESPCKIKALYAECEED